MAFAVDSRKKNQKWSYRKKNINTTTTDIYAMKYCTSCHLLTLLEHERRVLGITATTINTILVFHGAIKIINIVIMKC